MNDSDRTDATSAPAALRARRRIGLRTALVIPVLIPLIGMGLFAFVGSARASDERAAARRLDEDTEMMVEVIDARAAIAEEEVAATVLALAAELGASPEDLEEAYGTDFVARQAAARAAVDANGRLNEDVTLAPLMTELDELRRNIDAGTATSTEVRSLTLRIITAIDEAWSDQLDQRARRSSTRGLPGGARIRVDAVVEAYEMLSAGSSRAGAAISIVIDGPRPDEVEELVAKTARYQMAAGRLGRLVGPSAREALAAHREAESTQRFEETLVAVTADAVSGEPSPLSGNLAAFGEAFIDGATWGDGLTSVVRASARDLEAVTADFVDRAQRDLLFVRLGTAGLTLLALVLILRVTRWVLHPVNRLSHAAREIHEGRFALPAIEPQGPREVAETAIAFNDMASTLAAVESHTVALADDPGAPVLSQHLPGRTGQALQSALTTLRNSMQLAEQRRQELEDLATHDELTRLLNRGPAIDAIERDLAQRSRLGKSVAALFIDLDGLKTINDQYKHEAGDEALVLTAQAMQSATRATDVVARWSGDEFVVVGLVKDVPSEVQALAERVHAAITAQQLRRPGVVLNLGCSIGVALAARDDDAGSLISKADAAMYVAKAEGRNRISWYDEETVDAATDSDRRGTAS